MKSDLSAGQRPQARSWPLAIVAACSTAFFLSFSLSAPPTLAQPAAPGISRKLPDIDLPAPSNGNAAIASLGTRLPALAAAYGMSTSELARSLREDRSLWVDRKGRLFYIDFTDEAEPVAETDILEPLPYPLGETFLLNSKPDAPRTIYLDFDGHTISGTAWNNSYGEPIVARPYDSNGNVANFSDGELRDIQRMWRLVSEDFAPFNVNVTTQDPGVDAIRRDGSSDPFYGTRVVITADTFASCGCGGFAYLRAFDDTNDFLKPAFVFNRGVKGAGEAITHEAGHNLGLDHDGIVGGTAYYRGHGSGETGWAPIMGVGYYENLAQWSAGEYSGANNTQDDIALIQQYGAPLRADDHGDGLATATDLVAASDGTTATLSGAGVIGTRNDVDVFRFFAGGGAFQLAVTPAPDAPNLDVTLTLRSADGTIIAGNNPSESLAAALTGDVTAGEYFLSIAGTGKGDPSATGYTDYGSLGNYRITGTVADASGLQPPVAVADALFQFGPAPLTVDFSAAGSTGADQFAWDFGDGNTGGGLDTSHSYLSPGEFVVELTATNTENGLSDRDTLTVAVENRAPSAVIGSVGSGLQAPVAITFDGSASSDPDSVYAPAHGIEAWDWSFGDGATGRGQNPSHEYLQGGDYQVTLTVTDSLGATAVATRTVTIEAPPYVDVTVNGEATTHGQLTGTFLQTQAANGQVQTLRETESGGKPSRRTSLLEHRWYLDLPAGDQAMAYITAWQEQAGDGDTFLFSYQLGGSQEVRTPIQLTGSPATYAFVLPAGGGPMTLIARDSDRGRGNRALDSLFVDEIRVSVSTGGDTLEPPAAPTNLVSTNATAGSVGLSWLDNASGETGFRLYRSDDDGASYRAVASLPADTQNVSDDNVSASSTYRYYVASFNAAGESPSPAIEVATEDATGIQLSGSGSKTKGQKTATLLWAGASSVVIYRDGVEIASVTDTQRFEDRLGKGGGSYGYQVCTPDFAVCSDLVVVAF